MLLDKPIGICSKRGYNVAESVCIVMYGVGVSTSRPSAKASLVIQTRIPFARLAAIILASLPSAAFAEHIPIAFQTAAIGIPGLASFVSESQNLGAKFYLDEPIDAYGFGATMEAWPIGGRSTVRLQLHEYDRYSFSDPPSRVLEGGLIPIDGGRADHGLLLNRTLEPGWYAITVTHADRGDAVVHTGPSTLFEGSLLIGDGLGFWRGGRDDNSYGSINGIPAAHRYFIFAEQVPEPDSLVAVLILGLVFPRMYSRPGRIITAAR